MHNAFRVRSLLLPIFVAACLVAATAQEKAAPMDEKAMMEMMQKLATPGEGHKKLEPMVGNWTTTSKMWMDPSQPPQTSQGTSEIQWVLGGRYLEQRFDGTFMGMPFTGLGYTGYDNYKKRYVGVWMDTFGTAMLNMSGSFDGKALASTGTMDDFTTGKPSTVRDRITFPSRDEMLMEMWMTGADGKEFKTMEMRYTRKK